LIHREDYDFEQFSICEGMIAVPVEIYVPADRAETQLTVYSFCEEAAREFIDLYSADPFSKDAISYWWTYLCAHMKPYGFERTGDRDLCIAEYKVTETSQLNRRYVLPGTRLVTSPEELLGLQCRTTHLPDPDDFDTCAVHIEDGKIAAHAALNDTAFDEDAVEIHVECAPEYRNSGFATSCAIVLAEEMLREVETVRYHCRQSNTASHKVALKAGFTKAGTRYSFVFYRENSENEKGVREDE